ncbi:MAG TPA: serine/threonine protein phosphatase [Microscillaceae bacterium]|nr:serine/threonine protein phosphatase [Microscillaceae bacterium]
MKIAIFADLHGRLLLAFKLVERYQQETGHTIDLILQCGDVGIFPELEHLDRATLRHANRDRSELGFHDFFVNPHPKVEAVLENLACDMVCVRGNHEDHEFLDQLETVHPNVSLFPVDCYQRVLVCKSGHTQCIETQGGAINFVGIGRIGDQKNRNHPPFIQPYERQAIRQTIRERPSIDVLISHDVPVDMTDPGYGMKELRPVLNELRPAFHFYGHTGKPYSNVLDHNRVTRSIKVAELEYKRKEILEGGVMMILTIEDEEAPTLETVEAPWMKEYTKSNWLYID